MTIEVIGAGFGRTGTLSLKTALEEIGFAPCEHMTAIFDDSARIALWDEAARAKGAGGAFDWERLFAGYRATVDWPGAWFWRELVAAYPEAKVVLTVRDPERWYESVLGTIHRPYAIRRGEGGGVAGRLGAAVFLLLGKLLPRVRRGGDMVERVVWRGTFGDRFLDRGHALAVFRRHAEEVTAAVPAEKLLVFEVKEGWGPLCRFLGVPEPATPFPHVNDAADFQRMIRRRLGLPLAAIAVGIVGAVVLAVAVRRR